MKRVKVGKLRKYIVKEPVIISEDETLEEIILAFTSDPRVRVIYVVDKDKRLKGAILLENVINVVFSEHLTGDEFSAYKILSWLTKYNARDLMVPCPWVKDEDLVYDALKRMLEEKVEALPVVDDRGEVIGEINMLEILSLWLERKIFEIEE